MEEKNIVAIEIGSSKVRGAIGTYSPSGVLTVLAVEEEPTLEMVRYGAVSNLEEVASLINRIVRKIENRVSPRKVNSVYVAMGGRSFCSIPREEEAQFAEEVEITEEVLRDLIRQTAQSPHTDRELLQVVPREYIVDKKTVNRPKGTVGHTIRMAANLIVCRPQIKRNIDRLFNEKLKLNISGYKVRQIALGDVVLTSEEKRLGCMLVDFGAETTTVSIYKHGRLQYLATLPLGSRNITRDIMKLNHLEEKAEALKCEVGDVSPQQNRQQSSLAFVDVDYTEINNYVIARAGEIIANIHKQLDYAGYKSEDLTGGIVIVGGGSRLKGFNEALEKKLNMKLRTGIVSLAEVRIPDSRISASGAADVIAVLYRAALDGANECLSIIEPDPIPEPEPEPLVEPQQPIQEIQPKPEPAPAPAPAPAPQPEVEVREEPRPRKASWLDILKRKIENVMTESEDSDLMDD